MSTKSDYLWSATHSAFFRSLDVSMGFYDDWNLDDVRPASSQEFSRFTSLSSESKGKVLVTDSDGNPCWASPPPLTQIQEVNVANDERRHRILLAQQTIRTWETKLQLGRISDDEKKQLNLWLDYIDALYALDLSIAPDINWPCEP